MRTDGQTRHDEANRRCLQFCESLSEVLSSIGFSKTIKYRFLVAFAKLRENALIFVMSVHPRAWNNSTVTEQISMKRDIQAFFFFENFEISLKCDMKKG
jgi:hypothetical protein